MAQYEFEYACGHGKGIARLYGKTRERERTLAWYADNYVCPECYKKQKSEEDSITEKTAIVQLAIMDQVYLGIQVSGQLAANKDSLYDLGYRWDEELGGGLLAFFKAPKKALQKTAVCKNYKQMTEIATLWKQELDKLGYKITEVPTNIDVMGAKLHWQHKKEQAEAKANAEIAAAEEKIRIEKEKAERRAYINKIDPPIKPPKWCREILVAWNGKIYGSEKSGWRIYLNGGIKKITDEEKLAYERWQKDCKERQELWKD